MAAARGSSSGRESQARRSDRHFGRAPENQVRRRAGKLRSKEKPSRSVFRNARTRTATLFTSCSSRKRTPSASITTTRSRARESTSISTWSARGSKVSDPSAYVLDTGEKLTPKIMTGAELASAKIDAGEPVDPAAQVVVIPFSPVKAGQNIRVRISETYTAPASYRLDGRYPGV